MSLLQEVCLNIDFINIFSGLNQNSLVLKNVRSTIFPGSITDVEHCLQTLLELLLPGWGRKFAGKHIRANYWDDHS